MNDIFYSVKYKYTPQNFKDVHIASRCPYFLPIDKLCIRDVVVIPAPFDEDIVFIGDRWEISGDLCYFKVDDVVSDGVVLLPLSNMKIRGERKHSEMKIKIPFSNQLVLVLISN